MAGLASWFEDARVVLPLRVRALHGEINRNMKEFCRDLAAGSRKDGLTNFTRFEAPGFDCTFHVKLFLKKSPS